MKRNLDDLPRVKLKCESDSPSFDQRPHTIALVNETDEYWEGYLVETSDGQAVAVPMHGQWPKFAWTVVA